MQENRALPLGDWRTAPGLTQRVFIELVGAMLLVTAIIGSGIAAARLSPGEVGLQKVETSLVTGVVLVALILSLQTLAVFNPIVILVQRVAGLIDTNETAVVIAGQVIGGLLGAVVANLMFGLPALAPATQTRSGPGLWLGEVLATVGLLVVLFGVARSGRPDHLGYAVGGYLTAVYWLTGAGSFPNPAVTVARSLSNIDTGIAPSSAAVLISMQFVGGVIGYALIRALYSVPLPIEANPARKADLGEVELTDQRRSGMSAPRLRRTMPQAPSGSSAAKKATWPARLAAVAIGGCRAMT